MTKVNVGNLVRIAGTVYKIDSVQANGYVQFEGKDRRPVTYDDINCGIPITPDVLDYFEVPKDKDGIYYIDAFPIGCGITQKMLIEYEDGVGVMLRSFYNSPYNTDLILPKIKYFHQLQNLYAAICEEELPLPDFSRSLPYSIFPK